MGEVEKIAPRAGKPARRASLRNGLALSFAGHRSNDRFLSGRRVKGCTGGRTRSAGRSPSTERVKMQAKRTLDAAGTPQAYRQRGRSRATPAAPAPAASRARTDAGSPETEAVSGQARRARSRHKKAGQMPGLLKIDGPNFRGSKNPLTAQTLQACQQFQPACAPLRAIGQCQKVFA